MKNKDINFYSQTGAKVFLIAGSYILFGTVCYHVIEDLSWVDSLYFVVITLATIGYGDIVPKTNAGKVFTVCFIIFGLAIFSALITQIVSRARERREKKQTKL